MGPPRGRQEVHRPLDSVEAVTGFGTSLRALNYEVSISDWLTRQRAVRASQRSGPTKECFLGRSARAAAPAAMGSDFCLWTGRNIRLNSRGFDLGKLYGMAWA